MSNNSEGLKKYSFLHILIIAILAIAIYSNTLKNGFVYDDKYTIVNNTLIKSFDNLPLLLDKTAYFSRSEEITYRPVVTLTYFIDFKLYGLSPWGYHLTNIIIHAINGILLYRLLVLLIRPSEARLFTNPFIISLMFVIQPILAEAVNAVSFREDLLVFLFYTATLSLYIVIRSSQTLIKRPASVKWLYLMSCVTYSLALLSKEMAITLPAIIWCYEWIYSRDNKDKKLALMLFNRYLLGYIAIIFIYIYLWHYHFANPLKETIPTGRALERFLTIPWLILNYIKLFLFPLSLSAAYEVTTVRDYFSPQFLVPLFIVFLLLVTAFILRVKREISFGILLFIITLSPVYNIIPIASPFAERYLYLPTTGVVIVIGAIIFYIFETYDIKKAKNRSICVALLFFSLLGIYSFLIVRRNTVWKDDSSLWSYTIMKRPNNSFAHNNLGIVFADQHRYSDAIIEFQAAIKLRPDNQTFHYNLGNAYHQQQRYFEAIDEFKRAIEIKPNFSEALHELGFIYSRLGKNEEAIQWYRLALDINPFKPSWYNDLGVAYASQGNYGMAIKEFEVALRLDPYDSMFHNNLGLAYAKEGMLDKALKAFQASIELMPGFSEAHHNLGVAYFKKGLKDQAKEEFKRVLELRPDDLQAKQYFESLNEEYPLSSERPDIDM